MAPHYRERGQREAARPQVEIREPVPPASPLRACRVIVIDDDRTVLTAMHALFSTWGAKVMAASSTRDARNALRGTGAAPDLIVADLRLANGECGLAAIAELRSASGCDAPAIVVSGDTTPEARAEVAQANVALLQKPVIAADLLAAARQALHARARIA
jgi:DNA-binding NtrC family response regulator